MRLLPLRRKVVRAHRNDRDFSLKVLEGCSRKRAPLFHLRRRLAAAHGFECIASDDPRLKDSSKWKLRHAAALALVGWYLMTPPLIIPPPSPHPRPYQVDDHAPISRWDISQSFDHAEDCEKARKKLAKDAADPNYQIVVPANMDKFSVIGSRIAIQNRLMSATCIGSDDPRGPRRAKARGGQPKMRR